MSREIKFRAWNVNTKRMADWEEVRDEYGFKHLLGNDITVPLQYTGLKDKNGKEIYEGDIVRDSRIEESEAVIEYCQPIAAFVARPIIKAPYDVYQLNEGNTMGSLKLSYTEVIGNIYENPDLLKGEPNE